MNNKIKELTKIIRDQISILDNMNSTNNVGEVVNTLKSAGFISDQHVGDSEESFDDLKRVEWYGGQIISCLEAKAFFAINSIINCRDKFAPEVA